MAHIIKPKQSFNLDSDQVAVVDLLKETLAQALEGNIKTIGIVACMENGYAHVMAGRRGAELYTGCASMQSAILQKMEDAGSRRVEGITQ